MFYGEYTYSLDEKGRVTLPSRLREAIPEAERKDGLFVCAGQGDCLYLYTEQRWHDLVATLPKPAFGAHEDVTFGRMFAATVSHCPPDRQWRLLIPDHLRDRVGIRSEVVFVGVFDRIELWAADTWRSYREANRDALARLAGRAGTAATPTGP